MVRGLEEYSRCLTCVRISWSAFAFLSSFAAAITLTGIFQKVQFLLISYKVMETMACVGVPISLGIGGVAQVWDFIAHVMYLQDLWRPWLRGLK